jgi:CMP/dCMP kinase
MVTTWSQIAKKQIWNTVKCKTQHLQLPTDEYNKLVILEIPQNNIHLSKTSVITIDGLAASGKSSVAQGVAQALNVPYVSSGLLYRAVTYATLHHQINLQEESEILALLEQNDLKLLPKNDGNQVFLNEQDITDLCHSSLVDANVSVVALHQNVRSWVNTKIRALDKPFVAEGRDMGAVVFTDASVKLFLIASSSIRAKRRTLERPEEFENIKRLIDARDAKDAVNSGAATDAVVIDTDHLNLEEVIAASLNAIAART